MRSQEVISVQYPNSSSGVDAGPLMSGSVVGGRVDLESSKLSPCLKFLLQNHFCQRRPAGIAATDKEDSFLILLGIQNSGPWDCVTDNVFGRLDRIPTCSLCHKRGSITLLWALQRRQSVTLRALTHKHRWYSDLFGVIFAIVHSRRLVIFSLKTNVSRPTLFSPWASACLSIPWRGVWMW